MKKLVLASTSTLNGEGFLNYLLSTLEKFLAESDRVLFVPFARPGGISYDLYTEKVRQALSKIDKKVRGIHQYKDMQDALGQAEAIYVGGGNTFVLVAALLEHGLMNVLSEVVENGVPYIGSSAGSNIAGISMQTTNDMPVVYPSSFKTLGLIPFNINPHYLDSDVNSKHMGETRQTRIREFHVFNETPVIGLREGSWLEVERGNIILRGEHTARIFEKDIQPYEVETNTFIRTTPIEQPTRGKLG